MWRGNLITAEQKSSVTERAPLKYPLASSFAICQTTLHERTPRHWQSLGARFETKIVPSLDRFRVSKLKLERHVSLDA